MEKKKKKPDLGDHGVTDDSIMMMVATCTCAPVPDIRLEWRSMLGIETLGNTEHASYGSSPQDQDVGIHEHRCATMLDDLLLRVGGPYHVSLKAGPYQGSSLDSR